MSPFSAPVLAGAALLTWPAWWRAIEGTGTVSGATVRYLVVALACWVALEVVAAAVGPAARPVPVTEDAVRAAGPDPDDGPAVS
jgi:hypothetical protein